MPKSSSRSLNKINFEDSDDDDFKISQPKKRKIKEEKPCFLKNLNQLNNCLKHQKTEKKNDKSKINDKVIKNVKKNVPEKKVVDLKNRQIQNEKLTELKNEIKNEKLIEVKNEIKNEKLIEVKNESLHEKSIELEKETHFEKPQLEEKSAEINNHTRDETQSQENKSQPVISSTSPLCISSKTSKSIKTIPSTKNTSLADFRQNKTVLRLGLSRKMPSRSLHPLINHTAV